MIRREVKTGPSGPVFLCLLPWILALASCGVSAVQAPTIALEQVHDSGAHRIAFDRAGHRLASGGFRGKVYLWSVRDGRKIAALDGHADSIRGMAWLDDETLISADRSGLINVWDLSASRVVHSAQLKAIQAIALPPDRAWLLVAEDTRIRKRALPSLEVMTNRELGSRVLSVTVSHAGDRVAVSTEDGRVMLLDERLAPLSELPRPSRDAQDLRFSPDDRTLLAGGWFRLLVWDLEQGMLEERPTEHLGKVVSVDISPDGRRWLSIGRQTD